MTHNPQISIIVPVYKVERYLRKCLDSILAQTFSDFEVILVDDGSPDDCGMICDRYAISDGRIRVIHKENGGLSSARNAALDVAVGEYIMFVDSDDWVEPTFCETALNIVLENEVDLGFFGYNNIYQNDNYEFLYKEERFTRSPRLVHFSEAIKHLILKEDVIYNFSWNKIYKRTLFDNVRFPIGRLYEDNAVTYLLVIKAHTIFVADKILYNYLKRIDGISGIWYKPKAIVDRFEIWLKRLEDIKNFCPENELLQIKQLANEAVEGFIHISPNSDYGYSLDIFKSFLRKYQKDILMEPCTLKIKLYYHSTLFLHIYKYLRFFYSFFPKSIKLFFRDLKNA